MQNMKLREIVIEDAIIPNIESTERDVVISTMIDAFVAADAVDPSLRDDFIKAVIKRENRGSTGFGHGVAVPHVKHKAIEKMAVAIGVSHKGIDFNSLDRQPVHSVFLLLSPEERPEDHLDAMEAIFGHLSQDTFRSFLQQAHTTADILMLIDEADSQTSAP